MKNLFFGLSPFVLLLFLRFTSINYFMETTRDVMKFNDRYEPGYKLGLQGTLFCCHYTYLEFNRSLDAGLCHKVWEGDHCSSLDQRCGTDHYSDTFLADICCYTKSCDYNWDRNCHDRSLSACWLIRSMTGAIDSIPIILHCCFPGERDKSGWRRGNL